VQGRIGTELTLHTSHFLDGNPMQGRVVPRLVGFTSEAELEFFDLFCTVDKVGTRKALKALVRPVKEIANAIQRQDAKWLTTLPGIGAATAEQIVATLRRKVTKFALMAEPRREEGTGETAGPATVVDGNVLEDAYQALMSVGHSPVEARNRLDRVLATGKQFKSVEEILLEIYKGTE
jgi:Holliday junction DNA helicase RuvA